MPQDDRPVLHGLRARFGRLAAEASEMVRLRVALAESELRQAKEAARRLAVTAGLGAVLALTGLPLLAVSLALRLDRRLGLSSAAWMLIFGLTLLVIGLLAAWLGWRCFRSGYRGFEQSLEELREDLVWLRELSSGNDEDRSRKDGGTASGEETAKPE